MGNDNVCDLKHNRVDERLDVHDKRFDSIEGRQDVLEKSSVRTDTIVTNLCKKMDLLISVLLTAMGSAFIVLIGFLIWYIQQLD